MANWRITIEDLTGEDEPRVMEGNAVMLSVAEGSSINPSLYFNDCTRAEIAAAIWSLELVKKKFYADCPEIELLLPLFAQHVAKDYIEVDLTALKQQAGEAGS